MGDNTDTRILDAARKERRFDFLQFKNTILRRTIYLVFFALGSVFIAGGGWYVLQHRVDAIAAEVQAMPNPEAHKRVHELQDQDRGYLKQTVVRIETQQTIDAAKIDRTEKNVWKILQKLEIE